jgi:hypothetical protein
MYKTIGKRINGMSFKDIVLYFSKPPKNKKKRKKKNISAEGIRKSKPKANIGKKLSGRKKVILRKKEAPASQNT